MTNPQDPYGRAGASEDQYQSSRGQGFGYSAPDDPDYTNVQPRQASQTADSTGYEQWAARPAAGGEAGNPSQYSETDQATDWAAKYGGQGSSPQSGSAATGPEATDWAGGYQQPAADYAKPAASEYQEPAQSYSAPGQTYPEQGYPPPQTAQPPNQYGENFAMVQPQGPQGYSEQTAPPGARQATDPNSTVSGLTTLFDMQFKPDSNIGLARLAVIAAAVLGAVIWLLPPVVGLASGLPILGPVLQLLLGWVPGLFLVAVTRMFAIKFVGNDGRWS